MTRYSLDANIFLDMWRLEYPLYPADVFPSLRKNIAGLAREGRVFVCREAFDEVTAYGQEDDAAAQLRQWRKEHPEFVRATTSNQEVVLLAADISRRFPLLVRSKKRPSELVADPFVIAHASVSRATVVTNEKTAGTGAVDLGQIPDVCRKLDVRCVNLVEFMRNEGMEF